MKHFDWRADRVERLKELQALKHSASEIASKLTIEFDADISRGAIIGKLHRLGLAPISQLPSKFMGSKRKASHPKPAAPTANHQWKRLPAAEAAAPCHDDTRMYDLAPEAGGVLFFEMTDGCRYPMNAAVPIIEHRVCHRPRTKSGLPGDPYCTVHSLISMSQRRKHERT